ncbi:hypothetical protein GIB67_033413 [Kingdonia uniflora]|uniref:Cellulose synthase-like protein G3 n=1 Tax=Kingdonia uniflora TaxID=39325 RepID=A0A7J7LU34_9MAGN|nr:hypothetical protein GIB67_033413 [Kingdonia uniflora]
MGENPLHTLKRLRRTTPNRVFALLYMCALIALFYHHTITLLHSNTNTILHLSMLLSDAILAFMWATTQAFRYRPIHREAHPENLKNVVHKNDYPALDVFICTADPYKEPPIGVVNTALSVMAYEYPTEKISVYVSDDGGSVLTLFAFTEAARFAKHWLPFCKENMIMERSPEAYFRSKHSNFSEEYRNIKILYEDMKEKVESVLVRGSVGDEYIRSEHERGAFEKWSPGFTRNNHPTVIQVLLESCKDKDIGGHCMPNLVYISREKSKASPHKFKAGALNVLLRVSATMTNAPVILTQDCDMYSNDPKTTLRALCYFLDPTLSPEFGYVQFPQRFHGINKNDIYGSELKRLFEINSIGMDGLNGPNYVGTGCFFSRRAFFGGPSSFVSPEIQELSPNNVVIQNTGSDAVLTMAHRVADCNYEQGTNWGSKMGFRYGSLVEDYYTGYRLQCEGWKSVFCNPDRPAFLGDVPINLNDALSQTKRWAIGLLEVTFSKYNPVTFGTKSMGILMGLSYAHYAFWPAWAVPITLYGLFPPLALLGQVSAFPKISDPWFYLYAFLFLGAYVQDFLDFVLEGGMIQRWCNDQRMWNIRGISSYLFGAAEFAFQSLGISAFGFNITNKVMDDEQNKKYEKGLFEFGVSSPLFLPMTTIAILNLVAFVVGLITITRDGNFGAVFAEMFMCGYVMVNSWPIYEAVALRTDRGRMPTTITLVSTLLVLILYLASSFILT